MVPLVQGNTKTIVFQTVPITSMLTPKTASCRNYLRVPSIAYHEEQLVNWRERNLSPSKYAIRRNVQQTYDSHCRVITVLLLRQDDRAHQC